MNISRGREKDFSLLGSPEYRIFIDVSTNTYIGICALKVGDYRSPGVIAMYRYT